MSGKTIGFGVVGCGVVADYHIGAVLDTENARLAAVSSRSEERAREAGEKHGAAWYTDFHQLVESPDVDVVCICTPSGIRLPIVTAATAAGKHLIIEKPLDVNLANMDRIIQICQDAGVQLMGVFQLRYGEAVNQVRDAIQEGKLGRLVLGDAYIKWYRPLDYYDTGAWRGTWDLEGGGALMTQGSHTLDLLQWIMGPVKRVSARMDTLLHQVEVEDTVVALLEYESGALGVLEATTAAHPGMPAKLEFSGSQGTIIMEADQIAAWDVEGVEAPTVDTGDAGVARAASDSKTFGTEGHKAQIAEMVQILNEGGHPQIDGPEARQAIELILAIYQSARKGSAVELPLT